MEKEVIDTVLEIPCKVGVIIKDLSILHMIGLRSFKKDQAVFEIRPISMGTLIKISRVILDIKEIDFSNLSPAGSEIMVQESENMVKIIALAIHNKKSDPPAWLKDFLLRNLDVWDITKLVEIVIAQMDVRDFIKTIIAMKGMSLLNPGEKIASGEPSEATKSTSDTIENTSSGE